MLKVLRLFVASLAAMALLVPLANSAHAGATTVPGGTSAIEILSPANQARLAGVPVDIRAKFNVAVDIGSFTAELNGKDVTKHLAVTEAGVTGQLSIADGLRPSLGKNEQVSAPNLLKIAVRGKANGKPYQANRHFFLLATSDMPRASAIIGPGGGQVSIPGFGTVTFPAGAFDTEQRVELAVTADPITDDTFLSTAIMFGVQSRLPYEFRINTGSVFPKPRTNFQVTFEVPLAFRQSVPAGSEVRFFGENHWDGPNETLDTFELFGGRFTAADATVTATLPVSLFDSKLSNDGTYQAIVTLGTTPTARPTTLAPAPLTAVATASYVEQSLPPPLDARRAVATIGIQQAGGGCQGTTLRAPLDGNPPVSSPFGSRDPSIGAGEDHYGTDFGVSNGTPVRSMSDGVAEHVTVETSRITGLVKGWGQYVVVRHTDGSRSLYAHLVLGSPTVAPGARISAGDIIGASDTSGFATGPHLHIEYAPDGRIFDNDSKVDPEPCIGGNVTGSITVRDNGFLADDAFIVLIDGREVCRTAIGASNACAVGNLRPGTATLTITAFIAPDNVGTYEITLAQGLTFADGSTRRSGTIPQGGSASFTINIPSQN